MSNCHHIDWAGLQILIDASKGERNLSYKCLLCEKIFDQEEYSELIKELRQKKEDHKLDTWRTPKGETHTEEDCPNTKECEIHTGGIL